MVAIPKPDYDIVTVPLAQRMRQAKHIISISIYAIQGVHEQMAVHEHCIGQLNSSITTGDQLYYALNQCMLMIGNVVQIQTYPTNQGGK